MHPTVDKDRRIVLIVNVLARSVDDVNQFMENLDQTNAFLELRSREEQTNEDGQIESTLEMIYQPAGRVGDRRGPGFRREARRRPGACTGRRTMTPLFRRIVAENRLRRGDAVAGVAGEPARLHSHRASARGKVHRRG